MRVRELVHSPRLYLYSLPGLMLGMHSDDHQEGATDLGLSNVLPPFQGI